MSAFGMKILRSFLCLALVAFAGARSVDVKESFLDDILKNVLESLRESAKDLTIFDAGFKINVAEANVTGSIPCALIENLNKFVIQNLTTTLLPLRLTNLTLTLDRLTVTGNYSLDGSVDLPALAGPFKMFGQGPFAINLYGIFFTIAADFKLQDFKPQIAPNGLNGFNFVMVKSEINFENLMGGGEKGDVINKYLSLYLPDFINDYKFAFFDSVRSTLIQQINDFLAGKSATFQADQMDYSNNESITN